MVLSLLLVSPFNIAVARLSSRPTTVYVFQCISYGVCKQQKLIHPRVERQGYSQALIQLIFTAPLHLINSLQRRE